MNKLFGAVILVSLLTLSCGLPQVNVQEAPEAVSTGNAYTLAFNPVSGVTRHVIMYKYYWPHETSLISSDKSYFSDIDSLSPGSYRPNLLGFVQAEEADGNDASGSYPVDSSEITLNATGGTITLDFEVSGGLPLTTAVSGCTETSLYRRVREDSNTDPGSEVSEIVEGKTFFGADYDYGDISDYSLNGSDTFDSDGSGLDGDVSDLFTASRFDSTGNLDSFFVAFVVYSSSYDVDSGGGVESIPVYLGYIEIKEADWHN